MAGERTFKGYLGFSSSEGVESRLAISGLDLAEDYNAGWRGTVLLGKTKEGLSSNAYMAQHISNGLGPGRMATIDIELEPGDLSPDGALLRRWSVMVGAMSPLEIGSPNKVACSVEVLDPLSFLADRPVWGAYRGCSTAEMFGGVLSMAAGGDGKPTQWPTMAGFPTISISPRYRDSLEWLDYGIAAGHTLGEWLAEVSGLLGLRVELWGLTNGEIVVSVSDAPAAGASILAYVVGQPPEGGRTPIELTGIYEKPVPPVRAAVLDDVTQGNFRRTGLGSVGRLVSATGVDANEVAARVEKAAYGRIAEMATLSATSSQTGVQVGRVIELSQPIWRSAKWQVAGVRHDLQNNAYANSMTLLDASYAWVPPAPPGRSDVIVPATVDGGVEANAPVERDRMGRIPVRLAFLPLDAEQLEQDEQDEQADDSPASPANPTKPKPRTTDDPAVEFADTEHWDAEAAAFEAGELVDPFPGQANEALSESELAERQELAERRSNANRYRDYRRLAADESGEDRDHDGYVTLRDDLISDPLSQALADEARRENLVDWHEADLAGTLHTDFPDLTNLDMELLAEYGTLMAANTGQASQTYTRANPDGEDNPAEPEPIPEEVKLAKRDAAAAAQKWPARLPLPVLNPMAGRLHGFVPAHRQGDACRVAVHNPFSAEVLGFQYRDDRAVGAAMSDATAGLVVEHSGGQGWSGLVFRPVEALEEEQA